MIDPEQLLELIKNRRSIRSFKDVMPSDKEIDMIIEAGRWTPSASNRQPWEFIVIKDEKIIKEIAGTQSQGFSIEAPVHIAIVGKKQASPKWYEIDTSLASMNMMLMAWSLQIGTCWIGAMNKKKAKHVLGLNDDDYLLTILPFGYLKGSVPKGCRKAMKDIRKEM
ncbi:MAG: nitroreductase family protein [Promethearchaeota archaeon]